LYATSLLFLYDGATPDEIEALDDEEGGMKYSPDVRVKIVDFAHAITDLTSSEVINAPFPPCHPAHADRGYLKGLTSLKFYFERWVPECGTRWLITRIWREFRGDEDMFALVRENSLATHSSSSPFAARTDDENMRNGTALDGEDTWSDVSV